MKNQTIPKSPTSSYLLNTVLAAALAASLPFAASAGDKIKKKDDEITVKTQGGKATVDSEGNVLSAKGRNSDAAIAKARAELSKEEAAKFRASLVAGYQIPQDRYVYLDPLPTAYYERIPNMRKDVEYRVFNGVVYAVNPKTYTVVEVLGSGIVSGSTTVTTSSFDPVAFKASLVKGYIVPETYYTSYFQAVPETVAVRLPAAPAGVVYRYYDGTVYSVNPETYTIIDVVAY